MPRLRTLLGAALCLLVSAPAGASAVSLEPAVDLRNAQVETAPGSHADAQPIYVTSAPADPNRLFVVERPGQILEVNKGVVSVYASFPSLVSCCNSERGLLSIALAPDFETSGRFYAAYTGTEAAGGDTGDLHVDSFVPDGAGGSGGYKRNPIITWPHSSEQNHNGGQLQFGPDGHLYISAGDGGGGGDPDENGQNTEVLLGKILRIDPHPGADPAYSSPSGNPFLAGGGRPEVWAYGLRNPWRFSFDSANGDMVIGDVGQGLHEEVDFAKSPAAGQVGGAERNYGWNCREGFSEYGSPADACDSLELEDFIEPVWDYPHSEPAGGFSGCSITGGYVVRDESLGDLYGRYIYSDFCSGGIRSLRLPEDGVSKATDDRQEEIETPSGGQVGSPVSFGEDSCHRLYVVSSDEVVYRLVGDEEEPDCPEPENPPPVEEHPGGGGNPAGNPPAGNGRKPISILLPKHEVTVRAKRHRKWIAVRVGINPCDSGQQGLRVRLEKNRGKTIGVERLGGNCSAHFLLRDGRPAVLKAILLSGPEGREQSALSIGPAPRR